MDMQIEPQKIFTLIETDPKIPDGDKLVQSSFIPVVEPTISKFSVNQLKSALDQCTKNVLFFQAECLRIQNEISSITSQFNLKI